VARTVKLHARPQGRDGAALVAAPSRSPQDVGSQRAKAELKKENKEKTKKKKEEED